MTQDTTGPESRSRLPSLLEDPDAPPPPPPSRPGAVARFGGGLRVGAVRAWRGRRSRVVLVAGAGTLGAALALSGFLALRPAPRPDYAADPIDQLFRYTLLTDEFNNLPLQERLELIGRLVQRVGALEGSESTLLAGFAASIAGTAREQLEKNVSRLAVDLFDSYAAGYDPTATPEARRAYAEQAFIDFQRTMRALAGDTRERTDEELLDRGRRQAQRDADFVRSGGLGAEQAGRIFQFMNEGIGAHATAHQRARASVLLRDMSRTLRGQDVETGRPLPPEQRPGRPGAE